MKVHTPAQTPHGQVTVPPQIQNLFEIVHPFCCLFPFKIHFLQVIAPLGVGTSLEKPGRGALLLLLCTLSPARLVEVILSAKKHLLPFMVILPDGFGHQRLILNP